MKNQKKKLANPHSLLIQETIMLVLTRKEEQTVTIYVPPSNQSQTIVVKVIQTRFSEVRLGFDADKSIIIRRDEPSSKSA